MDRLRQVAPESDLALLDWLRLHVTRPMLEEISRNDYGRNAHEHFIAIQKKMDAHLRSEDWFPLEVLELERWADPDRQYLDSPPSGRYGHVKRLLACTLLLRDAVCAGEAGSLSNAEDLVKSSVPTLVQFTASVLALGEDVPRLALGFLLWVRARQAHPAFTPFASFTILLLAIQVRALPDPALTELCASMEQEEEHCRATLGLHLASNRWLVGLNCHANHRQFRDLLVRCGEQVLSRSSDQFPETEKCIREFLALIAA